MNDHITTVIKHFGNKISSWDVINEPLADYDQFENGQLLRNHKWHQAMGEDYIFEALKTAYQTNPELLYFINEYGLETDGERWDAFIALLTRLQPKLKSANIPVTSIGIGFQSHIYESEDRINPNTLRAHIKQLEQLGFKSQVSELDVYSDDGDLIQSNQYKDVFLACLNEPNCIAYRVWILSDKYDLFIDDDNSIQYGQDGLFDPSLKPRPAYNSILKEIKKY